MTVLRVYQKANLYTGFECCGHSGYGEEGSDIVCAAISTAVQFCIHCGETIDQIPLQLTVDADAALIRCMSKTPSAAFSKHIAVLVELGKQMAEEFALYFNLEIMEV